MALTVTVLACLFLLAPALAINIRFREYSGWATDGIIDRRQASGLVDNNPYWNYELGFAWHAMQVAYDSNHNDTIFKYFYAAINNTVSTNGQPLGYANTSGQMDAVLPGRTLLYLAVNPDVPNMDKIRFLNAARVLRHQLDVQPRTNESVYWYKTSMPWQVWLDETYMSLPFYAEWTKRYEPWNTTAWNDIANQFDQVEKHMHYDHTGLLVHGYDETRTQLWANRITGASPNVWGRALGWYAMALLDVLDFFPPMHPAHKRITSYIPTLAAALVQFQNKTEKGWELVLTQPSQGQYIESSSGAMFVYFIFKAARKGYIPAQQYIPFAAESYNALVDNFVIYNANGTLSWNGTVSVGSLNPPSDGSLKYYTIKPRNINDLKGIAPFILASIEREKLDCLTRWT